VISSSPAKIEGNAILLFSAKTVFKFIAIVILRSEKVRVKAVLFDLFDTLLLIDGGEAFYTPSLRRLHQFLAKNGISVSFEDFNRVYFEVRDSLYAGVEKSLEEPHFNVRVSRTLRRLGYNFDVSDAIVKGATDVFAEEFMRYVRLDEDAINILQKLYGKYKLGIISNFAIPECIWKLLEKFGLKRFFDGVLISGSINRRKPSPEIFKRALKDLRINASDAVFVGDSPSMDVKGAKNFGIKAILIERKTFAKDVPKSFYRKPQEENLQVAPDKVIRNLKELLFVLEDC